MGPGGPVCSSSLTLGQAHSSEKPLQSRVGILPAHLLPRLCVSSKGRAGAWSMVSPGEHGGPPPTSPQLHLLPPASAAGRFLGAEAGQGGKSTFGKCSAEGVTTTFVPTPCSLPASCCGRCSQILIPNMILNSSLHPRPDPGCQREAPHIPLPAFLYLWDSVSSLSSQILVETASGGLFSHILPLSRASAALGVSAPDRSCRGPVRNPKKSQGCISPAVRGGHGSRGHQKGLC